MIVLNRHQPRGIIWIASYPRSGNTWTRVFIAALVGAMRDPLLAEIDINQISGMSAAESVAEPYRRLLGKPITEASVQEIAAIRPQVQAGIVEATGRPVFIKTHNANLLDHGVPIINMAVSAGAIYVIRNPLDVAISFAHLRDAGVDQVIDEMATSGFGRGGDADNVHIITGSWSEHVRSWTDKPHEAVLVVRYEDMVEKPVETFGGLAHHLLMRPSVEQIERAIELSAFDRLRQSEAELGFQEKPVTSKLPFFREGRPGQWREVLSEEQVERVVAAHGPVMRRFGYLPANGG